MDQIQEISAERANINETAHLIDYLEDWRFLLPDAYPGDVGFMGSIRKELLDSIGKKSVIHEFLEEGEQPGLPGSIDLLMLHMPSLSSIRPLSKVLRPRGALYLEGSNHLSKLMELTNHIERPNKNFNSASSYIAALSTAGLSNIQLYWIWPDFTSANKFIGLNDSAPLIYAINKNKNGWIPGLKTILIKVAIKSKLILQLIPNYCIIAHRISL